MGTAPYFPEALSVESMRLLLTLMPVRATL
jgi:hypothetical protein